MSEINPYQAPSEDYGSDPVPLGDESALRQWRDGDRLVVHRTTVLSDRCVKTNAVAALRIRVTMNWHPSWAYLGILGCGIFYFFLAGFLGKSLTIDMPLSSGWLLNRKYGTWFGGAIILSAFLVPVGLVVVLPIVGFEEFLPAAIAFSLLFILFGSAVLSWTRRTLYLTQVSGDFFWLAGVSPAYLAELPVWPGNTSGQSASPPFN